MKKKKSLSLVALVLATVMTVGLFGCRSETAPVILEPSFDAEGRPIIHLWAEGSQEEEAALGQLAESYNALPGRKCTVVLQFIRSGTFDPGISSRYAEAYAAGEYRGFDIIADDASGFSRTVAACGGDENALLAIDAGKLPNLANVKMAPSVYADRLVAYRGNSVVFAYDSAIISQPPQTWEELTSWILANPGHFTYCDPNFGGSGEAFLTVGLLRLMVDPEAFANPSDPEWAEKTDEGFDWLKQIHPYLYSSGGRIQYPTKDLGSLDLLSSGEVWLVPVWADDVLRGLDQQTLPQTVKMYQMTDYLLPGSVSSLGICASTPHPEACCDFINFVISPEGQQLLVKELKAIPAVDATTLEQAPDVAAAADLDPATLYVLDAGSNINQYRSRWSDEIATIG